jgi:Fe-S-cluster containining protein
MPKIDFNLARERPEDLAHLDYEPDLEREGWALLRHRDGACVHLGPQGCTVYEHRPRCCRIYDCRLPAIAGLHERYEDGSGWPVWVPAIRNRDDQIDLSALRYSAFIEIQRAQKAGGEFSAMKVGLEAYRDLPKIVEVAHKLLPYIEALSPQQRDALAEQSAQYVRKEMSRIQEALDARD